MTARPGSRKQPLAPPWLKRSLLPRVTNWEKEPIPVGVSANARRKQIARMRSLVLDAEMLKVWAGIESKCVEAGFPSGEVAAHSLLVAAAYAIRDVPTAKERDVFHGGREAAIARQIRGLVSPGPLDSGPAFYGYESCVLFREWCAEALRIAEHFEVQARKRDTWEPPAPKRRRLTACRSRFMHLIGEELVRLFGDASTTWIEVITNAAFSELPANHKTAGEVSRALKARNSPP